MTKVVSAPHNIRYVIVIEPQLLQVSHSFENVFAECLDPRIGDSDLPEAAETIERPGRNLLEVTKILQIFSVLPRVMEPG